MLKTKFLLVSSLIMCFSLLFAGIGHAASEQVSIKKVMLPYLSTQINTAIHSKYGTDWLFHPESICESKAGNIHIEGTVNQNDVSKTVKITLNNQKDSFEIIELK